MNDQDKTDRGRSPRRISEPTSAIDIVQVETLEQIAEGPRWSADQLKQA